MNRAISITIITIAALLFAAACGGDSEPSTDAASSAAPPASAPTQATATVEVGHRVGDRAPEFTLALTNDRQITSTDLVAQGKPVFILFHATW